MIIILITTLVCLVICGLAFWMQSDFFPRLWPKRQKKMKKKKIEKLLQEGTFGYPFDLIAEIDSRLVKYPLPEGFGWSTTTKRIDNNLKLIVGYGLINSADSNEVYVLGLSEPEEMAEAYRLDYHTRYKRSMGYFDNIEQAVAKASKELTKNDASLETYKVTIPKNVKAGK